jgi:hypothetical protein
MVRHENAKAMGDAQDHRYDGSSQESPSHTSGSSSSLPCQLAECEEWKEGLRELLGA